MPHDIRNHPHYALLEYARNMHQYTLELWLELSKKLDVEQQGPGISSELPNGHFEDSEQSDRASDMAESPEEPQGTSLSTHPLH
ncbi:hypothetical protein BD414DRAFT_538715 [Trametes punicea]|nr:hypothetical protein BD414DRAFT_538715 [Trametes punicea]